MLLAREGLEEVRQEEVRQTPAVRYFVNRCPRRRAGRQVRDKDREATERQAPDVEVAQVDTVEALEVGFYGVGVVTK
jgi:hypothetical protein